MNGIEGLTQDELRQIKADVFLRQAARAGIIMPGEAERRKVEAMKAELEDEATTAEEEASDGEAEEEEEDVAEDNNAGVGPSSSSAAVTTTTSSHRRL